MVHDTERYVGTGLRTVLPRSGIGRRTVEDAGPYSSRLFNQAHRVAGHAEALAGEAEAFLGSGFHADLRDVDPERFRDVRAHPLPVRRHLRALGNDRRVDVSDSPAGVGQDAADRAQQGEAVGEVFDFSNCFSF